MARRSGGGGPIFSDRVREIVPIVGVVALALSVLAGLAVLPARTWMSQRQDMTEARADLARIENEVAELSAQLEQLQTDDEIERMARQHFDLVYPGEESYRIVPPEG
ncbi:MAG: septum formation initiator family protein [Actinomycetia bacterium]|nr:septum formation initiator family protein [Actinomycetes bacterium]MCP4226987.1 septum formation initiator family protein [Actinomycetes bacterium]MCP5035356.1 septum formation initiator family protein [Actinomycetes bacterium]